MKTILVVDDELANADLLCLLRIAEVRPQLVILDYMMPVMNGAEMGRAMRSSDAMRGIRILMNSSLPEEAVRKHFDGYDAFLRKPYGIDEALRVIARLLG